MRHQRLRMLLAVTTGCNGLLCPDDGDFLKSKAALASNSDFKDKIYHQHILLLVEKRTSKRTGSGVSLSP
jgi:hypothetical protein